MGLLDTEQNGGFQSALQAPEPPKYDGLLSGFMAGYTGQAAADSRRYEQELQLYNQLRLKEQEQYMAQQSPAEVAKRQLAMELAKGPNADQAKIRSLVAMAGGVDKIDLNPTTLSAGQQRVGFDGSLMAQNNNVSDSTPSSVQTAMWYENATPEQRAIFDRTSKVIRDAGNAGEVAQASEVGKGQGVRVDEYRSTMDNLPYVINDFDAQLGNVQQLEENIDNLKPGFIQQFFVDNFGMSIPSSGASEEQIGEARQMMIENAVSFLAEAKLQPVSESELKLAMGTLFDMGMSGKINKGQLAQVRKRIERAREKALIEGRRRSGYLKENDADWYGRTIGATGDAYNFLDPNYSNEPPAPVISFQDAQRLFPIQRGETADQYEARVKAAGYGIK